jgi:hypothetical protein
MFFPEKVHHTSPSDGLTLHTRVALSQNVKFGEMYISRISNFISETQIITTSTFMMLTNKQATYFIWVQFPKIVILLSFSCAVNSDKIEKGVIPNIAHKLLMMLFV